MVKKPTADRPAEMRVLAAKFERWQGTVLVAAVVLPAVIIGVGYAESERTNNAAAMWSAIVSAVIHAAELYGFAMFLYAVALLLRAGARD